MGVVVEIHRCQYIGSQTGAVGFLNGHSRGNRCQQVFEGVQLWKQEWSSFGIGLVLKMGGAGGLSNNWWLSKGCQLGFQMAEVIK